MAKMKLFGFLSSPPVRAVRLGLEALSLEYDFVYTNPLNGDTRTEAFLAMNPLHAVPVLKVSSLFKILLRINVKKSLKTSSR